MSGEPENIKTFKIIERKVKQPLFPGNNVASLNDYLERHQPKNIIVLCGAGISTNCGIPDFRSVGTGLFAKLRNEGIPYPEAVFSLEYFKMNPRPFYRVCNELDVDKYQPGVVHKFIRQLEEGGSLLRCYTQNIDTLERKAGVSDEKLVEAHGAFHGARCCVCHKSANWPTIKNTILAGEIPQCREVTSDGKWSFTNYCQGFIKPNVVLYGECMPKRFFECERADLPKCDLMIIIGSSLSVYPFAGLAERVPLDCPRVFINKENVELFQIMAERDSWRDLILLGDCDEIVRQICLPTRFN